MADLRDLREDQRGLRMDKRKAVEAAENRKRKAVEATENRELKNMDLAGERQLRADESAADYADKDRREKSTNQERREERAHDLAMMQMHLEISKTSRK